MTLAPADKARKRERCSKDPRSRVRRAEQAGSSGKPGAIVHAMPKLVARRQAKLHSIMQPVKVSAGRAAWKLPFSAKAERGSDSRASRFMKCSCCRSVADAG